MKRIIIFIPLAIILASCGIFGNAPIPAPQSSIPAWDGQLLVCGNTVSFAQNAVTPLPEYPAEERLGFCARSSKYLALHRQYGDKTTFFGISAETTSSFAVLYAPFMRRIYNNDTWEFAQQLNLALDTRVDQVVAQLQAGETGGAAFTQQLMTLEQNNVQTMLDALHASDPDIYEKMLKDFGGSFNPTNPMLLRAMNSEPFFAAYEASLAKIRLEIGGDVDFSNLAHRLKIAAALDQMIRAIAPNPEQGQ